MYPESPKLVCTDGRREPQLRAALLWLCVLLWATLLCTLNGVLVL